MNRKHFNYIFGNICRVQKQLAIPWLPIGAFEKVLYSAELWTRDYNGITLSQIIGVHPVLCIWLESQLLTSATSSLTPLRTSSCIAHVPQTKWPVCQVFYTARTGAGLSQTPFLLLPLLLPTKVHLLPPPTSFVQERCWGVCSCHCPLWADPPLWNAQN